MNIKRAVVTGGAGFIGSHIVDKLIDLGVEVLVIDNMRSGRESNFIHHMDTNCKKFKIVYKDIQSLEIYSYIRDFKPDTVYHLAAIPGVAYSVQNPRETDEVNVNGTVTLLEYSSKLGVKRFIFSSSSSVYGGSEVLPTPEDTILSPKSPYALQKKIGEEYCKLFSRQFGMETVCLRYFNVFGPRQYGDSPYASVISSFADCLKRGKVAEIHGDGEQFRDFCYVDNVVSANILAGTSNLKFSGEVFNIGCGGRTSINQLSNMFGLKKVNHTNSRPGDVRCSQADISKASNMLGYKVLVSFEDGLDRTIRWYNQLS